MKTEWKSCWNERNNWSYIFNCDKKCEKSEKCMWLFNQLKNTLNHLINYVFNEQLHFQYYI